MTDTAWSAELAIACAACGAPPESRCLNDQGHPVPYMHIDRVADATAGREAAAPETVSPDPQVVAWMRDRMSEEPHGMTAKDVRAYREANGLSKEDMHAAYLVATRKIEVRDDADGTDSLVELAVHHLARERYVHLRGEEWYAEAETPYALTLTQFRASDDTVPTGPKVRVTFTVHVEGIPTTTGEVAP